MAAYRDPYEMECLNLIPFQSGVADEPKTEGGGVLMIVSNSLAEGSLKTPNWVVERAGGVFTIRVRGVAPITEGEWLVLVGQLRDAMDTLIVESD